MSLYNDIDLYDCHWMENLSREGVITRGTVRKRSIWDLDPIHVRGNERVHLFAGIAGWDIALDLAGWTGEVWTGSCPCQPLSSLGIQRGARDSRHLWPAFFRLIRVRRPPTIFGEQVDGPLAREWLAAVRADMEAVGYAFGAASLPAAGVGAPHLRHRLFWVADLDGGGPQAGVLAGTHPVSRHRGSDPARSGVDHGRETGRLGDVHESGLEGHARNGARRGEPGWLATLASGPAPQTGLFDRTAWTDCAWVPCADGFQRPIPPVESGILPVADGVSNRVGRIRALGNAIVPQVAAVFIRSYMEARA